jgi:hypothetical protein
MALGLAAVLFAVFVGNVVMGATMRASFLTDVQEMLLLFAATIAFVASILRREAAARQNKETDAQ